MGVTRATVSGLMAALESEGLVKSHMDREDSAETDRATDLKRAGCPSSFERTRASPVNNQQGEPNVHAIRILQAIIKCIRP